MPPVDYGLLPSSKLATNARCGRRAGRNFHSGCVPLFERTRYACPGSSVRGGVGVRTLKLRGKIVKQSKREKWLRLLVSLLSSLCLCRLVTCWSLRLHTSSGGMCCRLLVGWSDRRSARSPSVYIIFRELWSWKLSQTSSFRLLLWALERAACLKMWLCCVDARSEKSPLALSEEPTGRTNLGCVGAIEKRVICSTTVSAARGR